MVNIQSLHTGYQADEVVSMPSKEKGPDIIEMLIKNKEAMAQLYGAYADRFPEYRGQAMPLNCASYMKFPAGVGCI